MPDWMTPVARRKLGEAPDWEICGWTRIGDMSGNSVPMDFLVKGGVPRLLKSGKRKGQKTWRDAEIRKCLVTKVEMDAEMARFEAETGKCSNCGGTGQEWAGWSAEKGHRHKQCTKCGGMGRVS